MSRTWNGLRAAPRHRAGPPPSSPVVGIKLVYEKGDRRRLSSEHADKIERILAHLDEATEPRSMDLPGFRLHPLKGDFAGYCRLACRATGASCFVSKVQMSVMSISSIIIEEEPTCR